MFSINLEKDGECVNTLLYVNLHQLIFVVMINLFLKLFFSIFTSIFIL